MTEQAPEKSQMFRPIKVWDICTRLFHWLLVALITTSLISIQFDAMETHVISGVSILGLLTFRLLWGVIGPSTAQFRHFVRSPRTVLDYLKSPDAEHFTPMLGHSPIGALSVVAMLLSLGVQAGTGLFSNDDVITTGPLEKFVSTEFSEWATAIHSINSKVLFALILLHVAAIAFYWIVKKDNLVRPMITGYKALTHHDATRATEVNERHPLIIIAAIVTAITIAVLVYNL